MFDLFADSVLPSFGLKKTETEYERATRLRKEREDARVSVSTIAPPAGPLINEALRKLDIARHFYLDNVSTTALESTAQQLRQAEPTKESQDLLAAVEYRLTLRPPAERVAAVAALKANTVPTIGPLVTVTPAGLKVSAGVDPASALGASVSAIGTGVAPKKLGGAAGIIKPLADAAGAITSGITALDRLFAANPPDP